MGDFVHICDNLTTEVDIELLFIEHVTFRLTFHTKLVLFKNIDI